jgi:hypothetical protein
MGMFTNTRVLQPPQRLHGKTWRQVWDASIGRYGPFVQLDPPLGTYGDSFMGNVARQRVYSYRTGKDEGQSSLFDHAETWGDAWSLIAEDSEGLPQGVLSPHDTGHPFEMDRWALTHATHREFTGRVDANPNGPRYRYSGHMVPVSNNGMPDFLVGLSSYNPVWYGTKAIEATAPTSSDLDLAVSLAELRREGFPAPGSASRGDAAGEYLNYEFGVKPLISDLEALIDVTARWKSMLQQYLRDSNKTVRRSHTFQTEVKEDVLPGYSAGRILPVTNSTAPSTIFSNNHGGNTVSILTNRRTSRRIWFNGAYVYNLDSSIPGMLGKVQELEQQLRYLTGIKVDAEVAWNLTPFSWLADWNANIGTNIANASRFSNDGLVLKYGYIMAHTTSVIEQTAIHSNGVFTARYLYEKKERARANPYGFALATSSYTDRQWAILGALGLTKAFKTLI